jgi:hypothetical protein
MATEHPFQALFETFGRLPSVHAESVNRQAYEKLWQVLAVGTEHAGRCVLLKAPRAGHGKTHLLSRIQHNLGTEHEFIPLHAASGSYIDAGSVTTDTLSRLSRSLPAGGGLCVLDLLVRKLFALALQPLVRSGEVPCQDREGALAALRNRPVETFDFHHPNAVTAHWARENFEVLGPRLALELAQRTGAPLREMMFWVDVLFRFAATPVEHPSRAGSLIQAVTSAVVQPGQAFERLGALLGMLTQLIRIILVADDLEGFSSDESSALRFASFIGSLRHSAERVDTVLSINRDIWESAFLPRLSGGLADRLSEIVIELEPLNREEMVALLDARAIGLGERVFARLDLSGGERHARGIIRSASIAWLKASLPIHPLEQPVVLPPPLAPPAQAVQPAAVFLQPEPAPAPAPAPIHVQPPEPPPVFLVTPEPSPVFLAPPEPPPILVVSPEPQPPIWTPAPVLHPEPAFASPFLQAAAVAPDFEPPTATVVEPFFLEKPVSDDFLPPVQPVLESASQAVPVFFQPSPPPLSYQQEIVPVGRIISDEELNFIHQETPPVAVQVPVEPPPIPDRSPAVHFVESSPDLAQPPICVVEQPVDVAQPPIFNPPAEVHFESSVWNPLAAEPSVCPAYGVDSPFQTSPPVAETILAEPPAIAPVQLPINHPQVSFSPPVVATVAAPDEAKETDRVDELLRQFRERYARS